MNELPKLTLEQAFANVKAVLAGYKGTLGEHAALQESIKLIQEICEQGQNQPDKVD